MNPSSHFFPPRDHVFTINGPVGPLELMGRGGASEDLSDWLVVICHPHPQHGGSMHNKVVTTVARAAREMGLDSLRFNYRGVGASAGQYGEFDGECEDFLAVMEWIKSNTDKKRIILAGFSFGSAIVAAKANLVEGLAHAVIIAPPVERYEYPLSYAVPVSVIQGAEDEVVDAEGVTDWVRNLVSPYEYFYSSDTSHFFHGKLAELRSKLRAIFSLVIA